MPIFPKIEKLDNSTTTDYRKRLVKDYVEKDLEKPADPIDIKRWYNQHLNHAPIEKKPEYRRYAFYSFYHAQVCTMIKQLNRYGIDGLLDPTDDTEEGQNLLRQQAVNDHFNFQATYAPVVNVVKEQHPKEGFDFDFDSPYGIYNWELFFHAPLTIAIKLYQNQKFEEAQKWFHYIFNPTETQGEAPSRYWKIKPFYDYHGENTIAKAEEKLKGEDVAFKRQLDQWVKTPFQPHAIAKMRTVAYMKTVVMKYLDNLIAWGDALFRRDTIESINEATQLYVLAGQILGPKPVRVAKEEPQVKKIKEVLADLESDENNILVELESSIQSLDTELHEDPGQGINSLNSILYFCTSPNDKLLGYWDTVADRLFKIRNCQNIEGITRSLALFAPPIDPALLVKAAAAGLDLGTVLNSISGASLPCYRFRYLVQKALDLVNDVKALGGALLAALEKKDAEELSLLRAGQEAQVLKAVREVRKQNIKESAENIASLEIAKELAQTRQKYYNSRKYMNAHEEKQLKKMGKAMAFQQTANILSNLRVVLAALPDIDIGAAGISSPMFKVSYGGAQLSATGDAAIVALSALSAIESHGASKAGIKGGYDRRKDDWELQADLATQEIAQVKKQLTGAEIRLAVAEQELQNHDLQTTHSQEAEAFMKDKYTNKDLYNWMITQTSGLYFQSYQLAYDVARMAEQAFRYELANHDTSFIQFGHWDSLKKGLLSGEKLQADIRRMEIAYIEQNKREYELTKHISLSLLAPEQLVALRTRGVCDIYIPEVLFDLDHPGQYMRRIKTVSLTIPSITGPYTNVNAKLTLLSSRTRKTNGLEGSNYAYADENDTRFNYNAGGIQSIATSSGQNDAGMFELNFQDERYLPFEGAGAVSNWRLEFSDEYRQFDYDTIADVVIHMNYTAREGGEALKTAANNSIKNGLNVFADQLSGSEQGMQRVFSLKTHFPNALYQLLQPIPEVTYQEATIDVKPMHFPHFLVDKGLSLSGNMVVMVQVKNQSFDPLPINVSLTGAIAGSVEPVEEVGEDVAPLVKNDAVAPLHYALLQAPASTPTDQWTLRFDDTDLATKLNSAEVEDILLMINYTVD